MVEPLADRVLALTLADEPGQLAALLLDRPRWEGPLDVEAAFGGRTPEGAAPLRSRVARAGGSCFVAAATTFSLPIVGWAAMSFCARILGSQLFQLIPS